MQALGYLVGAGSMSLGIEAAGFNLAEIWETPGYSKNAQTWDLNRPHQKHKVLELDPTNYTHFWQRTGGYIDLIYGNPPCGGTSEMTNSRPESPTNECMRKWIRMVAPAGARMILMENGHRLGGAKFAPHLKDLKDVLSHYGYYSWHWVIRSFQLGTPQYRKRLFLCATKDKPVREDLISTHDVDAVPRSDTRHHVGTWLHDLAHIPPTERPVTNGWGQPTLQHCYDPRSKVALWNEWLSDPNIFAICARGYITGKEWQKLVDAAAGGDPKAIRDRDRQAHLVWPDCPKGWSGMHCHRPFLVPWDSYCHTIIGAWKYIHPIAKRMLTMREMARLMGYPDHWNFHKLDPTFIGQGIPVTNAYWAADRMLRVIGAR